MNHDIYLVVDLSTTLPGISGGDVTPDSSNTTSSKYSYRIRFA